MIPTPEQEMVRDMARRFAAACPVPFSAECDRTSAVPRDRIAEMGTLGLMGTLVPEEYNGAASDYPSYVMAIEEIAAGNGALSIVMAVHNGVGCATILTFGTKERKQKYLKPMARGEWLGAFVLTEPHAGSDASTLRTQARRSSPGGPSAAARFLAIRSDWPITSFTDCRPKRKEATPLRRSGSTYPAPAVRPTSLHGRHRRASAPWPPPSRRRQARRPSCRFRPS